MKNRVEQTAIKMIRENGLINLSRYDLCERAGIPDGSFPYIMGCSFTDYVSKLKKLNIKTDNYPVIKSRVNPILRRDQILNVAVQLSLEFGYNKITRNNVAETAGVSEGLVSSYFNTMKQLRRDVIRVAIKRSLPEIIAQGLVNGDKHALKAPKNLKNQAANIIAKL